jgi:hypothetical protein
MGKHTHQHSTLLALSTQPRGSLGSSYEVVGVKPAAPLAEGVHRADNEYLIAAEADLGPAHGSMHASSWRPLQDPPDGGLTRREPANTQLRAPQPGEVQGPLGDGDERPGPGLDRAGTQGQYRGEPVPRAPDIGDLLVAVAAV